MQFFVDDLATSVVVRSNEYLPSDVKQVGKCLDQVIEVAGMTQNATKAVSLADIRGMGSRKIR